MMFGFKKKTVAVYAPFSGTAVDVSQVPDDAFASGMLGQGFAVIPPEDADVVEVCSPVSGVVTKVFNTLHAVALESDEGLEVLVHIGLETVKMKGEGFTAAVSDGARVEAGTVLIRMDTVKVRAAGCDPVTPVVFSRKKQVQGVECTSGSVATADRMCTVTLA